MLNLIDRIPVRPGIKTERASDFLSISRKKSLFPVKIVKHTSDNYLTIVAQWAKEFEENRYIPTEDEIAAMNSDIYFDLLESK